MCAWFHQNHLLWVIFVLCRLCQMFVLGTCVFLAFWYLTLFNLRLFKLLNFNFSNFSNSSNCQNSSRSKFEPVKISTKFRTKFIRISGQKYQVQVKILVSGLLKSRYQFWPELRMNFVAGISWLFICFSLAFHGLNSLEIFIFQFIIAGFSLNCSWAAIDWVVKTELINKMTDRNIVDAFTSDGARENNI